MYIESSEKNKTSSKLDSYFRTSLDLPWSCPVLVVSSLGACPPSTTVSSAPAPRPGLQRHPSFRPRPDTPGRLPDRQQPGPAAAARQGGTPGTNDEPARIFGRLSPHSPTPDATASRQRRVTRRPARPSPLDPGRLPAAQRARRPAKAPAEAQTCGCAPRQCQSPTVLWLAGGCRARVGAGCGGDGGAGGGD